MKANATSPKPLRTTVSVLVALVVMLIASPAALAAERDGFIASAIGGDIVRIGQDVFVGPGQIVDTVTVFGGDAVIAGTVRRTVVVVGGDIDMRATARVGTQMTAGDQSVLAIGGTATTAPGATVTGTIGAWEDVSGGEAAIAAAIAFTGAVIGTAILAFLVVVVLTTTAVFGLAVLIGLVWLVVWLVRRENRKTWGIGPATSGNVVAPGPPR